MSLDLPVLSNGLMLTPVQNSTNPGCENVASQGFRQVTVDQTILRSSFASASSVNSTGEIQTSRAGGHNGTLVTTNYGVAANSSGNEQLASKTTAVLADVSHLGLPDMVHAGSANHAKHMKAAHVECTPAAVTVKGDMGYPAGLAQNVNIR
jgi:hypothetical protein